MSVATTWDIEFDARLKKIGEAIRSGSRDDYIHSLRYGLLQLIDEAESRNESHRAKLATKTRIDWDAAHFCMIDYGC